MTAHAERERVAGVRAERRAGEQEQPDDRDHDRDHDVGDRARGASPTVSIIGVNTTNKPGDERGVRRRRALRARRSGTSSPRSRSTPNASAASTKSRAVASTPAVDGPRQPLRIANGASTIAPIENRNKMKPTGVTSLERVLHELERRAVRDRRRDQRELGQQRPRGLPRERDGPLTPRAPRSAGPAIGDREPAILAERLAATRARRAAPGAACTRCDRPCARRGARASASKPRAIELGDREVVLDVALDDRIEHVVRRQRVGVLLVGSQLGRRRLVEHRLRDHVATRRAR